MIAQSALEKLAQVLGPKGFTTDESDIAPWTSDWRGLYHGKAAALLSPASPAHVQEVLRIASAEGLRVVPQGGNTGLVGGQIPSMCGTEILLSLTRLRAVRDVDPAGGTFIAEAGVTLAEAQATAEKVGRFFPLSLASQGSCMIGGVLSTNAGGTAVLAYGNARQLCLGLEVVLADGRVGIDVVAGGELPSLGTRGAVQRVELGVLAPDVDRAVRPDGRSAADASAGGELPPLHGRLRPNAGTEAGAGPVAAEARPGGKRLEAVGGGRGGRGLGAGRR